MDLGSVWIEFIVAETKNWKHCNKIIFKCINSVVRPVNSTWIVREQCFLSPAHDFTAHVQGKKTKKKKLENVELKTPLLV